MNTYIKVCALLCGIAFAFSLTGCGCCYRMEKKTVLPSPVVETPCPKCSACVACPKPIAAQPETISMEEALQPLYFDFNEAYLGPEAKRHLNILGQYLNEYSSTRILIAGNCDAVGSEEYNMELGNDRALSAKNYLAKENIAADRMDIISYGKSRPAITDCKDKACDAHNRRDEFSVVK